MMAGPKIDFLTTPKYQEALLRAELENMDRTAFETLLTLDPTITAQFAAADMNLELMWQDLYGKEQVRTGQLSIEKQEFEGKYGPEGTVAAGMESDRTMSKMKIEAGAKIGEIERGGLESRTMTQLKSEEKIGGLEYEAGKRSAKRAFVGDIANLGVSGLKAYGDYKKEVKREAAYTDLTEFMKLKRKKLEARPIPKL